MILEKLGQGFNVKEITAAHKVGQKTVETHRLRIREKLGLNSSHDLALCQLQGPGL